MYESNLNPIATYRFIQQYGDRELDEETRNLILETRYNRAMTETALQKKEKDVIEEVSPKFDETRPQLHPILTTCAQSWDNSRSRVRMPYV